MAYLCFCTQREMGLEFFWLVYSYPGLNQSGGRSIMYSDFLPCRILDGVSESDGMAAC